MSESYGRPSDDATFDVPDFPRADETDLDELETDLEDTEADADEHDEASRSAAGTTRGATRRPGVRRADVRRIVGKYLQLAEADSVDLDLLGTLYGVKADATELTIAVMAGSRASLSAVNDLHAIAQADPFEAAIVAASLAPAELKAVHALLVSLGAASTKELPGGAVTKVAGRVARDVHSLPANARERLDKVLGLTKRTA